MSCTPLHRHLTYCLRQAKKAMVDKADELLASVIQLKKDLDQATKEGRLGMKVCNCTSLFTYCASHSCCSSDKHSSLDAIGRGVRSMLSAFFCRTLCSMQPSGV